MSRRAKAPPPPDATNRPGSTVTLTSAYTGTTYRVVSYDDGHHEVWENRERVDLDFGDNWETAARYAVNATSRLRAKDGEVDDEAVRCGDCGSKLDYGYDAPTKTHWTRCPVCGLV